MADCRPNDQDLHHAEFVTYKLAYAVNWFAIEAQLQWRLAEAGDPFPSPLEKIGCQIKANAEQLCDLMEAKKA